MEFDPNRIKAEINIFDQCRKLRLRPLECPRFLFVAMGGVTISLILFSYVYYRDRTEFPEQVALIAIGVAGAMVLQTFIVILAFEKVAETNRLKSEFINIMSHQMRSPLTAVNWALELLGEQMKQNALPPEAKKYTSIIIEAVSRMGELVNELLTLGRIEADRMRFSPESFSFTELVNGRVEQMRPLVAALNIAISVRTPAEPLELFSDREQARFVFDNLFDNAIRYSRARATITVTVERQPSFVKCTVADTGIGIPEAEQSRIFSEFFRASNAVTHIPGGTGLGLFISHELTRRLGGRIGFQSAADKGSAFWFTLPLTTNTNHREFSH